ncbi:MAG: hypothetical protein FWE85_03850 [Clostridiales bacterium]|nr:hypothetical protein [Clostridiales bacterium]
MNKRKNLVFALTFLLTLAMVLTLAGCSSGRNPPDFVGEWVCDGGKNPINGNPITWNMKLYSDGTGTFGENNSFTWEIAKGRFIINDSSANPPYSRDYELKKSTLTLTDEDGYSFIFTKK